MQPYRTCTIQGAKVDVYVHMSPFLCLPLYVCSLHTAVKLFARKAALMGLPPPVSPLACLHTYVCTFAGIGMLLCDLNAAMVKAGLSS